MRIGSCACIHHLDGSCSRMRSLGDACSDMRSTPWGRVDRKATVEERHPLAHGEQPEPVPVEGRATLVEAVTVVLHDKGRARVGLGDPDDGRLGTRVLADVRQRLLDDPAHLDLTPVSYTHLTLPTNR